MIQSLPRRSIGRLLPFVTIMFLAMFPLALSAQEPVSIDEIEIEPPIGSSGEELEDSGLVAAPEPLNLRRATAEQIASLPGLTLVDALSILELLRSDRRAGFETLAAVDGLDAEELASLRTYATLSPLSERPQRKPRLALRTRLRHDLQERAGYIVPLRRVVRDRATGRSDTIERGPLYQGSPAGIRSAIDYDDGTIAAHLLAAKDPGEPIMMLDTPSFAYSRLEHDTTARTDRSGSRSLGFFPSGGLLWRTSTLTLALGDYAVGSGTGLALADRPAMRRSNVPRSGDRLTLDRSATERAYLRGIALAGSVGDVRATLFLSSRFRDARIDSAEIEGESIPVVRSLADGAMRRTHSEIRRSGNLREQIAGARILWQHDDLSAGATTYLSRYSVPIVPRKPWLWSGRDATVVSVDAGFRIGRVDLRCEVARAPNGTIAIVGGGSARFQKVLLEAGLGRIPIGYSVPHGESMSPFIEGNGLDAGFALRASPLSRIEIDLAVDMTSPDSRLDSEESGGRMFSSSLAARYDLSGGVRLGGSIRRSAGRRTLKTAREGLERYSTLATIGLAGGIDLHYAPSGEGIRLRSGIHWRGSSETNSESGRLVYLEMAGEPTRGWNLSGRYSLFQGEAPVYQFEQLLPGWPRSVTLSGIGMRYWLKLGGEIGKEARIAAFVAQTVFSDRDRISAGSLEEIEGDSAGMAGLQLDLRFDL